MTSVDGQAVGATQMVWPRLAVLPMGWSHALELCQRVHEHLVRDSGEVSPEQAVVDRRRPPHLAMGAHAEYVDNFISFALEPDRANHLRDIAVGRLRDAGLPVHELNDARQEATSLGWNLLLW